MAMALHVAADHRAVEDVHRGEQRCRPVPHAHSRASWFQRGPSSTAVPRLRSIKAPESGSFHRPTGTMACGGRIDIEPDDVAQFVDEARVVGQLELAHPVRLQTMGAPDSLDRTHAEPRRLRHQDAGPMGRFPGRFRERRRDDALSRLDAQRLDARGTRLVAAQYIEAPSIKRSCQRQTQVLDFPVRLMIAFVPTPSAVNSTISSPAKRGFCGGRCRS